jgi:hypothetical protein
MATLAKLAAADVWIVLDNVQFTRRDYQHRARLAALGDTSIQQWLTLPVRLPDGRGTRISDVLLVDPDKARRRTERLLAQYYRRSPHWPAIRDHLHPVLATLQHTDRLADVAEASTRALLELVGWSGAVIRASTQPARTERSQRLADLTAAVRATTYLCGRGGARYLEQRPFETAGINVQYLTEPAGLHPAGLGETRRISALHHLASHGPASISREVGLQFAAFASVPVPGEPHRS